MRKQINFICLLIFLFSSKAYSQYFTGLSTGNYAGVSGVMMQPASIVDSRFKFDVNIFSSGVGYSNNYLLVDRNAILKWNKNNFDSYKSFKDSYLSEGSLAPGEKVFFNINSRVQLPLSFMATTGKKSAIALNMQMRTLIQGRDIPADLARLAYDDFYDPALSNKQINASGINVNSLSWAEAGFTYGRVLLSSGKHFLKGAVTGKYLAGVSSFNLASNDLKLQVNGDSTFNFNSTNVAYNHNKNADLNKLFNKNFSPDATTFGFDAGLVYEYRGNSDHFKYIRNDDEKSYLKSRRDVNKYLFRFGLSLLDAGMFRFDKPDNVNSFSANINNWNLKNAHYNSLHDFDTALAARVTAKPNDPNSYNIYLPTALSAQFDLRFVKHLFLNVTGYWPVRMGNDVGQRFDHYGFYAITPRFEGRHFGLYIPYTISQRNEFTDYKKNLLGVTLRAGPLFLGSNNLGTMLINENLRAADVHIGLKIGFTYGKPNKTNQILNTLLEKNQNTEADTATLSERTNDIASKDTSSLSKKINNLDKREMILNYQNGKVYGSPDAKQNIIIINNYYYGNSTATEKKDTIVILDSQYNDSDINNFDTLGRQEIINNVQPDSISKTIRDSLATKRTQLDSLIQSMQQLQKQMDSSINRDNTQNIQPINSSKKKERSAINPNNSYSSEVDRIQKAQLENDKKNFAAMRDMQNDLYRQYERQSARLANDINRLNNQLTTINQYKENPETRYIPMGIPYNNRTYPSSEISTKIVSGDKTDTVYITDKKEDTSLAQKTDTLYIRDTVTIVDTVHIIKKSIPDTVKIKEVEKQIEINYSDLPSEIILFGVGKWNVQPIYDSRLNFIADALKKNTNLKVLIEGHTDSTGPREINEKISLQRAESVAKYLIGKGASEKQIHIRSLSFDQPAVAGSSSTVRRQNRRVEVRFF